MCDSDEKDNNREEKKISTYGKCKVKPVWSTRNISVSVIDLRYVKYLYIVSCL